MMRPNRKEYTMHTDINLAHFLFRKTPSSWHPYIKLARLDRPIGIWLLLLPGWWAIVLASEGFAHMSVLAWRNMALFALGSVLMRSAGCIINDLWDRHWDARV